MKPQPQLSPFAVTLMRGLAEQIRAHVETKIKPLHDRIAALEARACPSYEGVFQQGRSYVEGSLVTDHGALWIAKRATQSRPGQDGDFQLIVKKGSFDHPPQRTATSQRGR
jgi:hypothetical protein